MKKRRLSAFVIALALAVGSVFPTFAAEHVVDTSKKGSLTIYKYDITGAGKAGIQAGEPGTGQKDESVENKLKDYAMEGVEFTYLRVGDVDTYSKNGDVKLIYGTWLVSACRDESTGGCYRYDRSVVCTASDDRCRWRELVL